MISSRSASTSRIAANSAILYARMIVVMIINLYTVRLVLNALGVVNYGIYDVVAGLIYVMSSVSNVLATATQRYYAVAIGEKSKQGFQDIFSASLVLYAVLAVSVLVLGESVGLWFVNNVLVVPQEKLAVANGVYQLSILTFILGIVHLPFSSAIIAHEDLGAYAAISIVESVVKLVAAHLIAVVPFDGVLYHGFSLTAVALLVALCFGYFAIRRYSECRFKYPTDQGVFRDIIRFAGWSLFGSAAGVGLVQGVTILVNVFFGPALSTARAISLQLSNTVSIFTGSLMTAVRPSMIKSYTEQSFDFLNQIFNLSNKFIFFGLLVVCLPMLLEMDAILALWLGPVDSHVVLFSRLIVVYSLIMALNNPISVIIQATGHVKEYHLLVEPVMLLCVPATFILFKLGYPAYTTYVAMILAASLSHAARLWCLKRFYREFSLSAYLCGFVLPSIAVLAIVGSVLYAVHLIVTGVLLRFGVQFALSLSLTLLFAYALGMTSAEKALLRQIRIKGVRR